MEEDNKKTKRRKRIKAIVVNIVFALGIVLAFNQTKLIQLTGLLFVATGLIFNVIIIANSNDQLKGGKK